MSLRTALLPAALALCLTASAFSAIQVENILPVPLNPAQAVLYSAADAQGNFLVTGQNAQGAFLYKLNSTGGVVFSTVLAGAIPAQAIADSHGDVYWIGHVFIWKLSGTDGSVLWRFDPTEFLIPDTITVDSSNRVLIAGLSPFGSRFNTLGAYSAPPGTAYDSFGLIRLTSSGSLDFAANYGGTKLNCTPTPNDSCVDAPFTQPRKILLDAQSHIWVVGSTQAADLPLTAHAIKTQCGCNEVSGDGFLAEFSADASNLIYATYFGTSAQPGFDAGGNDFINSAQIDAGGRIWFAGYTSGTDLPVTANAAQSVFAGDTDGFVAAFDPASNQIIYATYYGTQQTTNITRIVIGADGNPIVSGRLGTGSWNDQTTGSDFVAVLNGASVELATFPVGGSSTGLTLTASGQFAVSGRASQLKLIQFTDSTNPSIFSVTNSALLTDGAQISPGEIITIFGTNLGPATATTATITDNSIPTTLAGVTLLIGGVPAPLLYVSANQINAVVPFLPLSEWFSQIVTATVTYNGVVSTPASLAVLGSTPSVFLVQGSDEGFASPAAEITQDGVVNGFNQPGDIVTVFATGLGPFTKTQPNGAIINAPLPSLQNQVQVNWSGGPCEVLYAGPAPGFVAGAMQINFRIPIGIGSAPSLALSVNGWSSNLFTVNTTN